MIASNSLNCALSLKSPEFIFCLQLLLLVPSMHQYKTTLLGFYLQLPPLVPPTSECLGDLCTTTVAYATQMKGGCPPFPLFFKGALQSNKINRVIFSNSLYITKYFLLRSNYISWLNLIVLNVFFFYPFVSYWVFKCMLGTLLIFI